MNNPIYQQLGNAVPQGMENMQNMIQRFQKFKQSFSGDPRQQVQQLLNSGRVSQSQYNSAVQMAQQMQKMMCGK